MGDRGIVDGAGARVLDFSSSVRVFFIPFPVAIESIRAFAEEDGRAGHAGWAGTHEVLAAGPVRRVDRRGVRESSAAM